MTIDIHIHGVDAPDVLTQLQGMQSMHPVSIGSHPVVTPSLALYADDELTDELARRNGLHGAEAGAFTEPLPAATNGTATAPQSTAPSDPAPAKGKARGRPAKAPAEANGKDEKLPPWPGTAPAAEAAPPAATPLVPPVVPAEQKNDLAPALPTEEDLLKYMGAIYTATANIVTVRNLTEELCGVAAVKDVPGEHRPELERRLKIIAKLIETLTEKTSAARVADEVEAITKANPKPLFDALKAGLERALFS